MADTKGYVYFAIKTDNDTFDLNWFNSRLNIEPTTFRKKFEKGQTPKCTIWKYSTPNLTNPVYFEEIENLIDRLVPFKEEFKILKQENPDFHYVLEVVIFLGDQTPGLNFSQKALDFIQYVGGEIDCDIYNSYLANE